MIPEQLPLLHLPLCGLYPCDIAVANALLIAWEHRLGRCSRPFGQQAFSLQLQGQPVSVAISASLVSTTISGTNKAGVRVSYRRGEVVECARLCSAPTAPWATRPMLRLWRQVCAPLWPYWPIQAAVSYSQNAHHRGEIYRHDGWERIHSACGSRGGKAWGRTRYATDVVYGKKSLWVWRYAASPCPTLEAHHA